VFEPSFIALQALNGLSEAAVFFLLASGLTVVFGLMRIVNMAHGAFFIVGAYVGIQVSIWTQNLWLALGVAALVVAVLAFVVEVGLLRWVRGQELPEVLLTLGVAFVVADVVLAIWGGNPMNLNVRAYPQGGFPIGPVQFSWFKVIVMAVALVVGIALALVQNKTRVGAIVRAGVDDREMIAAMGINIRWVFTGMFVVGAALAAVGGVLDSGLESILPTGGNNVLLIALVVIIVGGLGSVPGAAIGAVLIGLIDIFAKVWIPQLSYFTIFLPMAVILVVKPTGLMGKKA
jgi:branched-chain amino acid transport system permease protein